MSRRARHAEAACGAEPRGAAAGETNVRPVALWRSLGFGVIGTVPEAFALPDGRLTGLHVMHRRL